MVFRTQMVHAFSFRPARYSDLHIWCVDILLSWAYRFMGCETHSLPKLRHYRPIWYIYLHCIINFNDNRANPKTLKRDRFIGAIIGLLSLRQYTIARQNIEKGPLTFELQLSNTKLKSLACACVCGCVWAGVGRWVWWGANRQLFW